MVVPEAAAEPRCCRGAWAVPAVVLQGALLSVRFATHQTWSASAVTAPGSSLLGELVYFVSNHER